MWVTAAASVCLLISTGMGLAASPSSAPVERAEYVRRLEAICAPGASATRRVVKGVRANVSRGLLKRAAGQFTRAAQIFGGTVKQISVVPRPSADMETLARWFTDLHLQGSYLNKIAGALRDRGKDSRTGL